jgi:mRNA interferase MazF
MSIQISRGDLYYADLSPVIGSEQGGIRPVLIIQNNTGNKYSPTIVVAAITSQICKKTSMPTHIPINAENLAKNSVVLLEQIRTIDKSRLTQFICNLDEKYMKEIDKALAISVGLLI